LDEDRKLSSKIRKDRRRIRKLVLIHQITTELPNPMKGVQLFIALEIKIKDGEYMIKLEVQRK